MNRTILAAVAAVAIGAAGAASAACEAGKARADMSDADAKALYDCLSADMHAGYSKGSKRWIPKNYVSDYRGWKSAVTGPAAPGFHGERYLVTWVNDIGYDAYVKFEENPTIPAGTLIAKESFDVSDDGKAKPGPLFIMEKTAAGKSPETMDWYYMMVAPNGAPQAVNVMVACSECHMGNYGHQGALGYPVEEVRVGQ